uniref:Nudix hydrolase 8 n=1 Tax=Canis lupus familiaris TaxID=9615 RepID=A0A8C0PF00_CANLF
MPGAPGTRSRPPTPAPPRPEAKSSGPAPSGPAPPTGGEPSPSGPAPLRRGSAPKGTPHLRGLTGRGRGDSSRGPAQLPRRLGARSRCAPSRGPAPSASRRHRAGMLPDYLSAEGERRCRRLLAGATARLRARPAAAAVLVPLCSVRGVPALLYTLRSSRLVGRHKGDVSFPGGKCDPTDQDVVHTALRETREELGLTVPEEHVWGVLQPVHDRLWEALCSPSCSKRAPQSGLYSANQSRWRSSQSGPGCHSRPHSEPSGMPLHSGSLARCIPPVSSPQGLL